MTEVLVATSATSGKRLQPYANGHPNSRRGGRPPRRTSSQQSGRPSSAVSTSKVTPRVASGGLNWTVEDYKDECDSLRKSIGQMEQQNSLLKGQVRKVEEMAQKREKQVAELLSPENDQALRRALGEGGAAAVITSLRQKVFRLESTIHQKELRICELESNIKNTKLEDLKDMLETAMAEIHRLKGSCERDNCPLDPSGQDESYRNLLDKCRQIELEKQSLRDRLDALSNLDPAQLSGVRQDTASNEARHALIERVAALEQRLRVAESTARQADVDYQERTGGLHAENDGLKIRLAEMTRHAEELETKLANAHTVVGATADCDEKPASRRHSRRSSIADNKKSDEDQAKFLTNVLLAHKSKLKTLQQP